MYKSISLDIRELLVAGLKILLLLFVITSAWADDAVKTTLTPRNDFADQEQGSRSVVLIGASYAKSWKLVSIGEFKVINKGIAGNETHEMLARFKSDVLDAKPEAVIIWGFINDIFRSTPEQLNTKLSRSRKNILSMIDQLDQQGIRPILATEVTITSKKTWKETVMTFIGKIIGKKGYVDYVNKNVMETNKWLRETSSEKNIMLLDFEKALANESGERKTEYAINDGSHLSQEAYNALSSYVKSIKIDI